MPLEKPMPPEQTSEKKEEAPQPKRGDFGISGAQELQDLEAKVRELSEAVESSPDTEKGLIIAEKKLELFLNEHDNAGAFKFKRLGREVTGFFEDAPDKPKVIETDKETGKLSLAESEKNRRLMFVNMGELDRFNKEGGGHGAGDAALKEAAKAIERIVNEKIGSKQGKEASYTLLRFSGNEFSVSFDDISKEDFDEIMVAVREAKPTIPGVKEPAPLVAEGFDFQETLDIVNQMQLELGPDERLDPADPAAATREIVEVMRKRANYSLDIDKFSSRVKRVQEKIKDDGMDGAKTFFDNYMKKMFKGTELEDIAKFEDLGEEEVEKMAFDYAAKDLKAANGFEDAQQAIIDTRVKEIRERRKGGEPSIEFTFTGSGEAKKLAEVPELTKGQIHLKELGDAAAKAEGSGDKHAAEVAKLDLQIEIARRDKGTGLLERGVHYENLEKTFKEGKEASLVFVDMGFLKYFDNKGGAEVGDAALKLAADLMENAIADSGVDGKAFRYGGDEYTVQIQGGPEEVAKFQKSLASLHEKAGAVPAGKRGSAEGYFPTEIVFNYGFTGTAEAGQVFEALKQAGHFTEEDLSDPDRVANIKAEIMTMTADKDIEEKKAVDRFMLLIDGLRDPKYQTDPSRHTQVEMLVDFSNKAIFKEKGGGEFLRQLAGSDMDKDALKVEIETWVQERIETNRKDEGSKRDLMDQLIEAHGKIRYYERALSEARHETTDVKQRNEKLTAELAKAQEERRQLIEVRKTLSSE